MGFTEAGAKAAIASYRSTMSLAGDEETIYDPTDDEDQDVLDQPVDISGLRPPRTPRGTQSFVFPLPNGAQAHISVIGGALTKQAVETMRKYLDLAKETAPDAEAAILASPAAASPTEPAPPAVQSPDASQD